MVRRRPHRSPSCAPSARSSGCRRCDRRTRASTGASRCRRSPRSSTCARGCPAELGRAIGVYPETKNPGYFADRGIPLEPALVDALRGAGLDRPGRAGVRPVLRRREPAGAALGAAGARWCTSSTTTRRTSSRPSTSPLIAGYADAVGVHKNLVIPRIAGGRPGRSRPARRRRARRGARRARLHVPRRERLPAHGPAPRPGRRRPRRRPRRVRRLPRSGRGRAVRRPPGHRRRRPRPRGRPGCQTMRRSS